MAADEVAICNIALGWVGANLITSLDDDSTEAILCKATFEPLRDAVLEEREWTFAIKRIEPAEVEVEEDVEKYGFDKAFQIPGEVIRVCQVTRADSGVIEGSTWDSGVPRSSRGGTGMGRERRIEWLREGEWIVANNAERVYARVIWRITDTTKFSPAFDQALAARMAMDFAVPLATSLKLQTAMAAMYGEKLGLAASSDGMQGRSYNVRSDSLTVVR